MFDADRDLIFRSNTGFFDRTSIKEPFIVQWYLVHNRYSKGVNFHANAAKHRTRFDPCL